MSEVKVKDYEYTRYIKRDIEKLEEEIGSFYSLQQVRSAIMEAKANRHKSCAREDFLFAKRMFSGTNVDMQSLQTLEDLERALPHAGFYEQKDFNLHLMRSVYAKYKNYPKAQQYIERVVRRLGDEDFANDSVRLAILKQFIKYTDYNTMPICKYVLSANLDTQAIASMSKKDKNTFVLSKIDESVFDILEQNLSQEERRKFTLLKLADDLSKGRFRTNGRTRNDLFVMALVFDMTCYLGLPGQVYDAERDFQKNLLFDFYNDSPMRYISDDYIQNSTNYESEPTGEGINFKNYAEMIYVYYMNATDLTPGEKLKKAESLIKQCRISKGDADSAVEPGTMATQMFKEKHFEMIMSLSEDALAEYITANFVVPVQGCMDTVHGEKKNRCTFDDYQATARKYHEKFVKSIVKELRLDSVDGFYCSDLLLELDLEDDLVQDEDFLAIISVMNERLKLNADILKIGDEETLSRNKLLVLFAYKYKFSLDFSDMTLPEIYEDFCWATQDFLKECRFQPMSTKNLFDYYLIISLFINR